jgi:sulfatase modifying factor 1
MTVPVITITVIPSMLLNTSTMNPSVSATNQADSYTPTIIPTHTYFRVPTSTTTKNRPLPTNIIGIYGDQMALVPAGIFQMGVDAKRSLNECQALSNEHKDACSLYSYSDEWYVHGVNLDAFYIDVYEVTNTAYAKCVEKHVCDPLVTNNDPTGSYYDNPDYASFPVIWVTWLQAQAYCQWRGARLPTEAEWEKAARGGLEGKFYPWGDIFDGDLANFCDINCLLDWRNIKYDDGYSYTAPVGSYSPNNYGLYDMAGNVSEWVEDWYDENYYSISPINNPEGPSTGYYRVARGGSYEDSGDLLGIAIRRSYDPTSSMYYLGFRCALSP